MKKIYLIVLMSAMIFFVACGENQGDILLREYDETASSFVKAMNEYYNGDVTALKKADEIGLKISELEDKLKSIAENFSDEQKKSYESRNEKVFLEYQKLSDKILKLEK